VGLQIKGCEFCHRPFFRNPKETDKQWVGRRYCSRKCGSTVSGLKRRGLPTGKRVPHLCECGCGEETLPQRKWLKGHRPLKPTKQGYRRVWAPDHPLANGDGNVLEHRKVLYDSGEFPKEWHVHHRNGEKLDNDTDNLEAMPADEHHRRHAEESGWVENQYGKWALRQ